MLNSLPRQEYSEPVPFLHFDFAVEGTKCDTRKDRPISYVFCVTLVVYLCNTGDETKLINSVAPIRGRSGFIDIAAATHHCFQLELSTKYSIPLPQRYRQGTFAHFPFFVV